MILLWAGAFAYLFRLGFNHHFNPNQLLMILGAPLIAIPVFAQLGLYRAVLRYLPEKALLTIFRAMVISALLWTALAFFSGFYGGDGVPRTVPFLYGIVGFLIVSASRFTAKWLLLPSSARRDLRRTLIYGAGNAGTRLARSLREAGEANVLGFVDDDPETQGRDVAGMRVYPSNQLAKLVENLGVEEIILSIPSAPGSKKLKIGTMLSSLPVTVRVLPSRPGADSRYRAASLEKLEITELIGRSPVPPDQSMIENVIRGRRIMITGAGGSIGSQLARLVDQNAPRELLLVDNNEFAAYEVARSLTNARQFYPSRVLLGSVTREEFVRRIFDEYKVDVVFHTAAYKHVDLVEQNVREGIRNNIFGTEIVARIAFESGVKNFVLISSDKAVNPTSVMGATKRIGELITRSFADAAADLRTGQHFLSVRFGNVVGSSGSVVPLFAKQIERGGPVTVTDRNATRYFMAVSEAVELIVQAAAMSRGGEIFLLDMGDPISIRDLARDMIGLAGYRVRDEEHPDGDIEIEYIGLRPGEKLHEELWYGADTTIGTGHPKIMMVRKPTNESINTGDLLAKLEAAFEREDETELRNLLLSLAREQDAGQRDSRVIPLPTAKFSNR